ncbi:MAG: S1C family serine protease [candidate division Zixibacteria bacterium]|nr:S1C family serine protease [candidate division Zixibacteria bacterium]
MRKFNLIRFHLKYLLGVGAIFFLPFLAGCQKNSLNALEKDVIKLRQKVGQYVVCLVASDVKDKSTKLGSGIIVDENHILVTENFLGDIGKMRIMLQDGRVIEDSQIVNTYCDFETNLSLLEIKGVKLKPVERIFKGKPESGTLGVALFNSQYSKGLCAILGSVNPSWIGGDDIYDEELLIFNPLSGPLYSGTPVFNTKGELLGLVEGRLEEEEGMVLLVSANTCQKVSKVLRENGRIERGWIGIASDKACKNKKLARIMEKSAKGILITEVVEKSPACDCGLKPGDIIMRCNGEEVDCKTEFRKKVSSQAIGSSLVLGVVRQGKEMNFKVEIKPRPEVPAKRRCPNRPI